VGVVEVGHGQRVLHGGDGRHHAAEVAREGQTQQAATYKEEPSEDESTQMIKDFGKVLLNQTTTSFLHQTVGSMWKMAYRHGSFIGL
jgi:hypothetical protein